MVSLWVMILFLALGVLTVCHAGDPEESAEMKAYSEATENGDYARALALGEALRDKYPDSAVGWRWIGVAHIGLSDQEKAIESLGRAIKIDPDYVMAHYNLGNAWAELGQDARGDRIFPPGDRTRPAICPGAW